MDFRLKVKLLFAADDPKLVSILVLMDFRLKEKQPWRQPCNPIFCFNPCSNGLSAQSVKFISPLHQVGEFQSLF